MQPEGLSVSGSDRALLPVSFEVSDDHMPVVTTLSGCHRRSVLYKQYRF